ncbi:MULTISPECIES: copper resistance CopC family protein [Streptomyces]|uniref:copper resistance CopC family protein n=1 Tax=Streptomyces lycopersici TaxID=2974589 RepID=UPI0021CE9714|nr:copper resistance CopC family protein [Streptomyces sp. NEAU-383]
MFTTPLPRATVVAGLLVCAAPVAVATAPPAAAHTELTGNTPGDGARLTTAPGRVSLSFNDQMDARYSRIAVTGASGRSLTTGPVKVDGRTVTRTLAADVPPGRYTVGYRVVSADGHPVSGSYTFTVTTARTTSPAPTTAPSTPAEASPEESSGPGVLPVAAGAAVVLAGVGGAAYATHKRRSGHGG